jgi:hypothetical protein
MAAREVVRNEFFRMTLDDDSRTATLVRKAAPFASLDQIDALFIELARATRALPRGWALLLDARDAPARNDSEFEAAFARARRPILERFSRVAVLVKSATGKLQVQRYAREDQSSQIHVFADEDEARAYLKSASRRR